MRQEDAMSITVIPLILAIFIAGSPALYRFLAEPGGDRVPGHERSRNIMTIIFMRLHL
jgi:hypothetical protein